DLPAEYLAESYAEARCGDDLGKVYLWLVRAVRRLHRPRRGLPLDRPDPAGWVIRRLAEGLPELIGNDASVNDDSVLGFLIRRVVLYGLIEAEFRWDEFGFGACLVRRDDGTFERVTASEGLGYPDAVPEAGFDRDECWPRDRG